MTLRPEPGQPTPPIALESHDGPIVARWLQAGSTYRTTWSGGELISAIGSKEAGRQ